MNKYDKQLIKKIWLGIANIFSLLLFAFAIFLIVFIILTDNTKYIYCEGATDSNECEMYYSNDHRNYP